MYKTTIFAVAILSVIAILSSIDISGETAVKPVVAEEQKISYLWQAEQCTQSLAVQCAVDIEMTVRACAKAFETEGADVIADIKCAKDLLADKKNCWPCICAQAKKKGWKVIGC